MSPSFLSAPIKSWAEKLPHVGLLYDERSYIYLSVLAPVTRWSHRLNQVTLLLASKTGLHPLRESGCRPVTIPTSHRYYQHSVLLHRPPSFTPTTGPWPWLGGGHHQVTAEQGSWARKSCQVQQATQIQGNWPCLQYHFIAPRHMPN